MQRHTYIRAVHESQIKGVLEQLGRYTDLIEGNLACTACGAPITLENLQALLPSRGDLRFCCNSAECQQGCKTSGHKQ